MQWAISMRPMLHHTTCANTSSDKHARKSPRRLYAMAGQRLAAAKPCCWRRQMRRREVITLFGGAVAAWPLAASAQQSSPVMGFLTSRAQGVDAHLLAAFQQGLRGTGYDEGRNLAIEYRFAQNQYDRLPALAADLVRRQVSVIFANG